MDLSYPLSLEIGLRELSMGALERPSRQAPACGMCGLCEPAACERLTGANHRDIRWGRPSDGIGLASGCVGILHSDLHFQSGSSDVADRPNCCNGRRLARLRVVRTARDRTRSGSAAMILFFAAHFSERYCNNPLLLLVVLQLPSVKINLNSIGGLCVCVCVCVKPPRRAPLF